MVNEASDGCISDTEKKENENISDSDSILPNGDSITQAQDRDHVLNRVIDWVKSGNKPVWADISFMGETAKHYLSRYDYLKMNNGVVCHAWETAQGRQPILQVAIPKSMKTLVLQQLHNSITGGYLGVTKTLSKVRDRYVCLQMSKDVKHWCITCDQCSARKSPSHMAKAPLQTYNVGAPMERWAMDVLGPLPLRNDPNQYLLVVAD